MNKKARDILTTLNIARNTPLNLEGNLMAEIPTPTTGYAAPARSRPLGVTIIAILMILGALMNLIGSPLNFAYGVAYGSFYTVIGVINLIIGIALFQLIPWARMAAIIMELIGIVIGLLVTVWMGSILEMYLPGITSYLMISMIPSVIIGLIVVIYLMQGSVKAAFEGTTW